MAGIDLPNSPTDGQTFTSGNATYTYIASKGYWKAVTNTVGIQLSNLSVGPAATASGTGAVSYDNSTGVFTYTPPVISTFDGITSLSTVTEKTSLPGYIIATGTVLTQEARLGASDAQASDYFGISASISSDGNTAIVGAYFEDTGGTNAGAAYIFVRSGTTWSQQAKIQSSVTTANDYFGSSVSISDDGNTVIVGASAEDTGVSGSGAAYIFTRSGTTWSEQAKLKASSLQGDAEFGAAVSISGDGNTAIVGAFFEDVGGITNSGAAYIFTKSGTTWSEEAKVQGNVQTASAQFGIALDLNIDGNTVVIGSRYDGGGASDGGAAYIFTRSGTTWSQQAKLFASDIQTGDDFGRTVSISNDGNTLIVGGWAEDTGGTDAGAAYIFTRSGTSWSEQAKIVSSDLAEGDGFGLGVGISGDGLRVVVGAALEDTGSAPLNTGAAYIFTKSGTTWTQIQKIIMPGNLIYAGNDYFGWAVSISNDGSRVLITNRGEGTDVGAAYIHAAEYISIVLHDISQSSIFTHSGLTQDITANFTNVPTTNDRTIEIELVIEQGATGYLPTAVQIDGVAQTFVWENGVTPTPSINASDIVKYTLLRSADTWTVLASLTRFTDAAYPTGGIALTDFSVGAENPADGDGGISYDNTTGVFTYTPPVIPSSTLFTDLTTFAATTEIASVLTGATGVVAHDVTSNSLFVHSSVATNFTVNFTNAPTTNDRTISVALIINQGATGYLPTAVQIDGVAQTILWQGSTTPTAGTSAIDIASFTLIRSGSAWTVIGTVTAFGVA